MDLQEIFAQFHTSTTAPEILPYGNGHIHDTYRIGTPENPFSSILQKINTNVFADPAILIDNHLQLLESPSFIDPGGMEIPRLIPTHSGEYLYRHADGSVWRAMTFIEGTHSLETCTRPKQAFEAGRAYGWFNCACLDLDPGHFREAIPAFHDLASRLARFRDAQKKDVAGRKEAVAVFIDFFECRADQLLAIQQAMTAGEIPVRITHNDTKINNVLFRGDLAAAVIDLDTVGPGTVFYDYGDALRTLANAAKEDELDVRMVKFDLTIFEAFTRGYLHQTGKMMTKTEKEWLYLAPKLMSYIMGIRFLTDFLQGDIYYKITYPEHNLIRTQVQQKLILEIEAKTPEIQKIIDNYV